MAKSVGFTYREKPKKKRPGVHAKTKKRKKKYRGQGR